MKKYGKDLTSFKFGIAVALAVAMGCVEKRRRAMRLQSLRQERKLMLAMQKEIDETLADPDHEFNPRVMQRVTKRNSRYLRTARNILQDLSEFKERGTKELCLRTASRFLILATEHYEKVMKQIHDLM